MTMDPPAVRVLAALLVLLLLPTPGASVPCPRPCSCPQPSELHCTFRSLVSIPPVSRGVERMNLGFNSINRITDRSLAGMRRLELLMIHGNNIHSLPDGAFRDLSSLQMLKLSYNKLKRISGATLEGLWSLTRLHLDHNWLEFIQPDAFHGLTALRLLQLEGNRLRQLHSSTFATVSLMGRFHLSTLKHLYLSDNGLTALPPGLVETTPQLENLYLHGNPWTCDCNMKWLHRWSKNTPGVLKCKKDRALPGGQLCPLCSSPKHLQRKELQALEDLVCTGPVISTPRRLDPPEDVDSEVLTIDHFRELLGNMSLGLSDEHGNEVELECSVGEPRELSRISLEQINQLQMMSNITLSVDLECPVDRDKYEQLWRLIAYYSNVPAHLKREVLLSKEPHPTYVYRQDSEKDAQYYTGVKVNVMAQPRWLMQTTADLQLNRLQSSGKMVKLVYSTQLSETMDMETLRTQRRTWVMIESTNTTRKVSSVLLGRPAEMDCNVHSSGDTMIRWMLPDGSEVEAPNDGPDNRVSISADGRLVIKAVGHNDAGIYYCIAKVRGDLSVLPFYLSVQDSSSPPPGEDAFGPPVEGFVGDVITLPCTASASPDAEVNWILPNSNIISSRANSSRALVFSNGTLQIPQSQLLDSGFYKCVAMNQHGVDTLATKITIVRRKGLIRPVRKFPGRPQSASGVNTKIKVPTEDTEESSGDMEEPPVNRLDPLRRRFPGGVPPGRRGSHPSRTMWRRPPLLRKPNANNQPTGSRGEDRKNIVDVRRRTNMSKPKIDPEKWADILAKIRVKNAQTTVTPSTIQPQTAQRQENIEGSSDSVTAQDDTTTAQTQLITVTQNAQDQGTLNIHHTWKTHTANEDTTPSVYDEQHTTSSVYDEQHTTSSMYGEQHTTSSMYGEQHTTSSVYDEQHTTSSVYDEQHTTSSVYDEQHTTASVLFFPQTTSAPHNVTVWQTNTNTEISSRTFTLQQRLSTNTDVDGGKTADWSKAFEESENRGGLNPGSSNEDTQLSVGHIIPSVDPNTSGRKKENGKYLPATTSPPHPQPKDTTLNMLLTTASPSTTKREFEERPPRLRQPHSKRKNGGRRKRPNRRKQKQNKPTQSTTTTPAPATAKTTAFTPLKIDPVEFTTASFSPYVPFTGRQTPSSGSVSHKESPFLPTSPHKPTLKSTSVAPWFPTVSPEWEKKGSEGALGKALTSTTQQSPWPPVPPSESLGPPPYSDNSSEGFHTETQQVQTPAEASNSHHQLTTPPSMNQKQNPTSPSHSLEYEIDWTYNPTETTENLEGDPTTGFLWHHQERPVKVDTEAPFTTAPPSADTPPPPPTTSTTSEHPGTHKLTPFMSPNPTSTGLKVTTTPVLTMTSIRTDPPQDKGLTSTQDASRDRQPLPEHTSVPRGKPRITKSDFETLTVKAETDAELRCEAEAEPKPFLSWTKVSSGFSVVQNTRVQRLEVHPNGSLTIRNTQPVDGGQYLCKVQNRFGSDQMLINLVVLSRHPRVLQPRHRDVTVPLGGAVDLDCTVEGHPAPRVMWVLPNHVHMAAAAPGFTSQHRVSVSGNGTLQIVQAALTDRGIYKCIGSSAAGADTVSVRVFVSALPPVIQQMQHENISLPEGSATLIHCTATGAPPPSIHWTTPDNLQLTTSQVLHGHNLMVFPNGTLYMHGLSPVNAGKYKCTASNAVGSSRRTVILSVTKNLSAKATVAKATVTSASPQRTHVVYGGRLLLDCEATGTPEPRIIWRTPSKKLVDAQYSFDPRIVVFPNGSLTVHPVTDLDGGDYLCVARNKMGDDYVLLSVDVLTRPAKIEQKWHRSSQEVVYGGDLKVDCVASGLPNPEISWALPDGTMVNPVKPREDTGSGRSRRYVVFDNGTLFFNDIGMREEGDYTCYAVNQLGKDQMKVRVKVKAVTSPPQIHHKDQTEVRVSYGETVLLRCNAKGEPTPVVTWISPTNRVITSTSDKYQLLNDGTLVVQKVQRFDGGNYTCTARNSAGQDNKVIPVEILVTPPTIRGVQEAANSIKVSAVQDQRKLVDCVAQGTPPPRIMWVLPENMILPAPYQGTRMTVFPNGTLDIRSPKRTDSGQLVCIARNEGGEVRLLVTLEVTEAFQRPPTRGTDGVSLTVGNAMTLNCSVEDLSLPHVTWILPNGTPLLRGARLSKFFHRPDGSLVIANPSVTEAGTYRCLGRSAAGLVERIVTLSPGRKPEIINTYQAPVAVVNGEPLLLHCITSGEPLRLTWTLPSGVILNQPQRAGRYSVMPNGTLSIQQVSVYDRGSYICRAANEYGSSLMTASVTVMAYAPRITSGPPSVTYARRGVAVQLNCLATGIPNVEVAWETPDKARLTVSAQPRLFGNKYLHPRGALIIQNPTQKDTGVYRCTARNAVGVDSKSTYLNVF